MNDQPGNNPASSEQLHADASPEKRFFISMLVRDIEIGPAILDLVDNSIEGAHKQLRTNGDTPDDGYVPRIDLTITSDRVEVTDNAGGIPLEIAQRYAFRFGRPPGFPAEPGGVGQFGVGLKRALFKLGDHFTIVTRASNDSFEMDVNVEDWANESGTDWNFPLQNVKTGLQPGLRDEHGTSIEVTKLHPSIAEDIEQDDVVEQLRIDLQLRAQVALEQGIVISLNEAPLKPEFPTLLYSKDIGPIHVTSTLADGDVSMDLYCGLSGEIDDEREDDDAEQFRAAELAGWYLFCNDRLLVVADKTPLSGWGTTVAAYHPQYRRFRGYVFLSAQDAALLPWNTTKTGVDRDSSVFRAARVEMDTAMKRVISIMNRVKTERQTVGRDGSLQTALRSSAEVRLSAIPQSKLFAAPKTQTTTEMPEYKRIQYDVAIEEFERVRDTLGAKSASEVGRQTFAYYLDTQVDKT